MEKIKCYECAHRHDVNDSYYSNCDNIDAIVKGHEIAVESGWFNWPHSFDPVWLLQCDGFKKNN